MREFSVTALVSKPSEVMEVAETDGVILTRHGKRRFALISLVEYRALARARTRQEARPGKTGSLPGQTVAGRTKDALGPSAE